MRRGPRSIVIVGAGFAGIGAAIQLTRAGFDDVVVLEASDRLGGTWRDNTYPGVACDVPSYLYSYSFAPSPAWTEPYAAGHEILAYLNHVVDACDVRRRIRFGHAVERATWDPTRCVWIVRCMNGVTVTADVLIAAAGHALSRPISPSWPGQATFAGQTMHSARWDPRVPLDGRRVGVIGTGASAVQIVPAIASRVRHLDVFQRTPGWVRPKVPGPVPERLRRVFAEAPWTQRAVRGGIYAASEWFGLGLTTAPRLRAWSERRARAELARAVPDPSLRTALTPRYRLGCKRVLFSNDYYPALQRPNVALITTPIVAMEPAGVRLQDGTTRALDVVIYATGFEAADAAPRFEIIGEDGRDLANVWADDASAYLGTTIAGFPNCFMLVGPNTGTGHSSMIVMMEAQIGYLVDALRVLRERGARACAVTPAAQATYQRELARRLAGTVWATGGCSSWYVSRTGRNTTLWPGTTLEYRWRTRRFDVDAYRIW